ncbi:DUF2336 domain-containing protein [Coralliovum pocilloporae]|uniref:DUF2336 domain-containing protein n=1 Tax=Coralliovum pocilloporae TaxID=3066369 RepID=UPI003306D7C4
MLDRLTALASDTSSEKRRELLSEISDLFLTDSELHSDREILLFRDVLTRMLDLVDVDAREQFSNVSANNACLPRELALKLANDEINVAEPILKQSPVLTDNDMISISRDKGDEHRVALAKRETLSEPVTDALLEHGGKPVWQEVSSNKGACFSENGMNRMAEEACHDDVLRDNLAERHDLPKNVAEQLLPILPPDAKDRLARLFQLDHDKAEKLLDDAQFKAQAESLATRQDRLDARILIRKIQNGQISLDDAVNDLADHDQIREIALVLSSVAELPESVANNVLLQVKDEPSIVLCRSVDLSDGSFHKVALLRARKLRLPESTAHRSLSEYKKIDLPSAQRAIRFVKMRQANTLSIPR